MVGSFTNSAVEKILEHITGKVEFEKPTTYIALCKSAPTNSSSGATIDEVDEVYTTAPQPPDEPEELSTGYSRVQTLPSIFDEEGEETSQGTWDDALDGEIKNILDIEFPEALCNWGPVGYFALVNSQVYGEGDVLAWGSLTSTKTVDIGDAPLFEAGDLILKLR